MKNYSQHSHSLQYPGYHMRGHLGRMYRFLPLLYWRELKQIRCIFDGPIMYGVMFQVTKKISIH